MDDSDEALIERHRAGDRDAFPELMRRHQRSIYFFALRMSGREEDARDLTQRTFLRAFRALDGFEGRASFRSWVHRIASNLARNHHRDRTRVTWVEADENHNPSEPQVVEALSNQDRRSKIQDAVEGLAPRQQAVLKLRVYQDLSFKEIAAREGITPGNARVHYHLAVKALKERMRPSGEGVQP